MTVVRVLVIVAAVAVVVSLPCLLILLLSIDEVVDRVRDGFRRRWPSRRRVAGRRRFRSVDMRTIRYSTAGRRLSWRQRRRLVRLDRTLPVTVAAGSEPVGPPIEQVAADLRRLGRQRTGVATRSPIWFAAVQKAYDERLQLACRELGIEEHLSELADIDQQIERVRVEGALQAAGLKLHGCQAPYP